MKLFLYKRLLLVFSCASFLGLFAAVAAEATLADEKGPDSASMYSASMNIDSSWNIEKSDVAIAPTSDSDFVQDEADALDPLDPSDTLDMAAIDLITLDVGSGVETDMETGAEAEQIPEDVLTTASALLPNDSDRANQPFQVEAVDAELDAGQIAQETETAQAVDPGTPTRTGSSYLGVGFNAGFGDTDTPLGEFSFATFAKIGMTPDLSLRPAVLIRNDVTVLVPITLDVTLRDVGPIVIGPYVGGGLAIATGSDSEVGPLLTGGVDVPFDNRFTGTAAFNLAFFDDITAGFMFGVGYNF